MRGLFCAWRCRCRDPGFCPNSHRSGRRGRDLRRFQTRPLPLVPLNLTVCAWARARCLRARCCTRRFRIRARRSRRARLASIVTFGHAPPCACWAAGNLAIASQRSARGVKNRKRQTAPGRCNSRIRSMRALTFCTSKFSRTRCTWSPGHLVTWALPFPSATRRAVTPAPGAKPTGPRSVNREPWFVVRGPWIARGPCPDRVNRTTISAPTWGPPARSGDGPPVKCKAQVIHEQHREKWYGFN